MVKKTKEIKCNKIHMNIWIVGFIFIMGMWLGLLTNEKYIKIEYRDNPEIMEKLKFCTDMNYIRYDDFELDYNKNNAYMQVIDYCYDICTDYNTECLDKCKRNSFNLLDTQKEYYTSQEELE